MILLNDPSNSIGQVAISLQFKWSVFFSKFFKNQTDVRLPNTEKQTDEFINWRIARRVFFCKHTFRHNLNTSTFHKLNQPVHLCIVITYDGAYMNHSLKDIVSIVAGLTQPLWNRNYTRLTQEDAVVVVPASNADTILQIKNEVADISTAP